MKEPKQVVKHDKMPFTCVKFINSEELIAGGYDRIPALFRLEGGKWYIFQI